MKKLIAAALLAGAAFIAVPTAANAAGYTPDSDVSVSGDYVAGGTAVVAFTPGAFIGGETVRVQVTGAGTVTLGALPVTTTSRDYTANADGSLNVRVTFPVGGSGTYNLTATGVQSTTIGRAVFTIAPAGTAGTVGSTATPAPPASSPSPVAPSRRSASGLPAAPSSSVVASWSSASRSVVSTTPPELSSTERGPRHFGAGGLVASSAGDGAGQVTISAMATTAITASGATTHSHQGNIEGRR